MLTDVQQAVELLKKGDVVIVPTDTVYGLAVDPAMPAALEKLFQIKGRDSSKPIPLLAFSLADVERYGAEVSPVERRLAEYFWPGPLTLILKVGEGTEGFRVPSNELALGLIRQCGGILRVTSANLSGEPPALTASEALHYLRGNILEALDGGRAEGGVPSSVVQVKSYEDGRCYIHFLREGAVSREHLFSVLDDDCLCSADMGLTV